MGIKTKILFLGACTTIFLSGCGKKSKNQVEVTPKAYPVAIISTQPAGLEIIFPATVRGEEDIEIRPRVDGFIDAIYIDEGSSVKKGQALFKINSPSSEQAVASGQAAVNSSQAQLNTAQVNVDRIRPLAEKGIISPVQLQTYENAYKSAQASLKQAEATLRNAQATREWATVTSPVDGVAGTIPYRQGSLVDKEDVLTTVANTRHIYAYFSLNEKELMEFLKDTKGNNQSEKIKNLPEVTLITADGSPYPEKGRIETISGVVNISTGSVNLRAKFPNNQGMLRSGSSGKIAIPIRLDSVFVVPQEATFTQQDKVLLYKVENNTAKQTIISVRSMPDGKNFAVTGGLFEGDTVIVEGVATLHEGQKIDIQK